MDTAVIAFLAKVAFISLSGVMMPGPVFAVTMAKGQRRPYAGAVISLGHAVIEFPLILMIYFGLGHVFTSPTLKAAIGFLGGAVLIVIGYDMVKKRDDLSLREEDLPYGSMAAGIVTTLANPYFFIWWATVGASLVLKAATWKITGITLFFIVHWLCDFGWSLVVSGSSHKAGTLWSEKVHRYVFLGCGILLAFFGLWFIQGTIPWIRSVFD